VAVEPSQIDERASPLYAIGLRFLTLIAVIVIAFITENKKSFVVFSRSAAPLN
jgi:cbb3-type cytochrome oxidase subunit 3